MSNAPSRTIALTSNRFTAISNSSLSLSRILRSAVSVLRRGRSEINGELSIRRNLERFPLNFMFQLTDDELENLRSQIATSSAGHGGPRYLPYAFTEHGVAMLSSVLSSKRAVALNIL